MIQQVILAEYEKFVGGSDPVPTLRWLSERLRALEQLKTDGWINEEEYNGKRTEILGKLSCHNLPVLSSLPISKSTSNRQC